MGGAAFIRVGLAVVQLVLRASGQDGAASTVGDAVGLWDQIRDLGKHRGNQVRAARGIAEDIAAKLSGDPEYRDVSDNQWEAASAEVTDLLSGLSEPDRLAAEYSWEALRDALLADGGSARRSGLGDEAACRAFDRLLEISCWQVANCFSNQEALKAVLGHFKQVRTVLGELENRPIDGQPVTAVLAEHREKVRALAPSELKEREKELADLTTFVRQGTEPWLAYEAPMRSGKTALMATFAVRPPTGVRVVSYFARKTEAGHDRNDFVFVVLAQLAQIVGDRYVRAPRPEEQTTVLSEALRLAAAVCKVDNDALVLLIDGLDEDAYFERPDAPGAASILSVLPRRFPRGVRVVTASRPNPPVPADVVSEDRGKARKDDLEPSPHAKASIGAKQLREFFGGRLGLPVGAFLAACDDALTSTDLYMLLSRYGTSATLDEIVSFVSSAPGRLLQPVRVGRGEGVTAYRLGHDIVLHEVLRRLEPERFGEWPDPEDERWWAEFREQALGSYRDVIVRWAEEWVEQHGWSSMTPSYLLGAGYLSVVRRRAGLVGVLEVLAERTRNDEVVRRRDVGYSVIHAIDETVDAFLNSDEWGLIEGDFETVLLVSEERERLARGSVYIPGLICLGVEYFRMSPDVLLERLLSIDDVKDRIEAIHEVLESDLPADHFKAYEGCVLGALDFIEERSSDLRDKARQLRARALTHVGQFSDAEDVAGLIEDSWRRAEALVGVARALAGAGDVDSAVRTARLAEESARLIEGSWRRAEALVGVARALVGVARALAGAGDVDSAVRAARLAEESARLIEDPRRRAEALVGVAEALAGAGDVDSAVRAARLIEDPRRRAEALVGVARALAGAGDVDSAVRAARLAEESARLIEVPRRRDEALVGVARALAGAGGPNSAAHVSGIVESRWWRVEILTSVALTLSELKVAENAERVASLVENWSSRIDALFVVARFLARVGNVVAARRIVRQLEGSVWMMQHPKERVEILRRVAVVLIDVEDVENAEDVAWRLETPWGRAETLVAVARAFARIGSAVDAERVVDRIKITAWQLQDPKQQANVLIEAAWVLAQIGKNNAAVHVVELAKGIARMVNENDFRSHVAALFALIRGLGQFGGNDNVIDLVGEMDKSMKGPQWRAGAVANICDVLIGAGNVHIAMDVIQAEIWRAQRLADRHDGAKICSSLAATCHEICRAFASKEDILLKWQGLAAQCLVRSWMLGASVWENFEVLVRVAPSLAEVLIRESLLTGTDTRGAADDAGGCVS